MYEVQNYNNYRTNNNKNQFKIFRGIFTKALRFGRDFCLETTMHGFNHIAASNRHWIERLIWVLVTIAAIWGAAAISLGQLQRYQENPTVTTLQKDFRNWNFDYPAITMCYADRVDPSKLPEVIKSVWNVTAEHPKYEYYSRFVNVVANSDLFHLQGYQEFKDDESLNVDLMKLAVDVIPEMQMKPTWSEDIHPPWFPVITEAGACYISNCLASLDAYIGKVNLNETKNYPLSCAYASLNCYVMLEVSTTTNFYFHSPYDVVDMATSPNHVYKTLNKIVELSVTGTNCGKGVRELKPSRRSCHFTDEPDQSHRKVYSTNNCRLSCRHKMALKLCGCRPFYYFYEVEGPICTPEGMACLSAYAHQITKNGGLRCACAQQCVDSVYKEVAVVDQYWEKGTLANRGAVKYTIQAPRTRYTREIVFHFQDLVVSFGGAAGLYLGASFISLVEIIYFVAARTLRACVKDDKAKALQSRVKNENNVSYEEYRIKELTRILEHQEKFRHVKMYPY